MLSLILLIFAFVLAVVAGVVAPSPSPAPWGWRLLCFSIAAYFLAEILFRGVSQHLF